MTLRTNLRNDLNLIGGAYFIDGRPATFTSAKIVRSAADLSGSIDSSSVYLIDGFVDLGTTQIVVPEGGVFGVSER